MPITKAQWYVNGGEKYATIESRNTNDKIVVTHPTIATVNSTFIDIEEFRSNAKLIADSPNLLATLKQIADCPIPGNEIDFKTWADGVRNLAIQSILKHD